MTGETNGAMEAMRALVLGLGSMGKRRVRNLQALGVREIHGFDLRADRRAEAASKLGIPTHAELEEALTAARPDVWVISVPPHVHHIYLKEAVTRRIPCFVELSLVDTGYAEIIRRSAADKVRIVPSATFVFHPGIRLIKRIVQEGRLGRLSNFIYHAGQYLPDWHPYEKVSEFFVSRRDTGGAREIASLELIWIADVFGIPERVAANVRRTIVIEGAEQIDDTYDCLLDFGAFLGVAVFDVVSRQATRRLLINGQNGQLVWEWGSPCVRLYSASRGRWEELSYDQGTAAPGYHASICEEMYIDELRGFLAAVTASREFPLDLPGMHRVLKLLYALERASESRQTVVCDQLSDKG